MVKFSMKRYHLGFQRILKSGNLGRVAERLKALVLKTSNRKLFVGSNPTSSATNTRVSFNQGPDFFKWMKAMQMQLFLVFLQCPGASLISSTGLSPILIEIFHA